MAEPIVLKAADVIAAARKAYEEGRLSAQGPTPECEYRDSSGRPCAIGAALSDEFVIDNAHALVGQTVESIDPTVIGFEDEERLSILQTAHDAWARAVRLCGPNKARAEDWFRQQIGLPPKAEA